MQTIVNRYDLNQKCKYPHVRFSSETPNILRVSYKFNRRDKKPKRELAEDEFPTLISFSRLNQGNDLLDDISINASLA